MGTKTEPDGRPWDLAADVVHVGVREVLRIAAIMAGLVSGRQNYDGLRRRLLLTGEWRLAIEYLRLSLGR